MRGEFTTVLEQDGDWFIAYCPEVPGANGQGKTVEEAKANLAEAIDLLLEDSPREAQPATDLRDTYRQLIRDILTERASIPYAYGDIKAQTVFDTEGDHYLYMIVGWDEKRVHGCIVHVDLIGGKFWIQRDRTEEGIASELVAAGVPKDHIVLAFRSPDIRELSGYAVA
jgi:predicted RNase H-like HicB family nuclease